MKKYDIEQILGFVEKYKNADIIKIRIKDEAIESVIEDRDKIFLEVIKILGDCKFSIFESEEEKAIMIIKK